MTKNKLEQKYQLFLDRKWVSGLNRWWTHEADSGRASAQGISSETGKGIQYGRQKAGQKTLDGLIHTRNTRNNAGALTLQQRRSGTEGDGDADETLWERRDNETQVQQIRAGQVITHGGRLDRK